MKTVRTCGKLYLAGEYAILTAGQPALIKAIPIYLTATIDWSQRFCLRSDMFDDAVDRTPDSRYALIQETVTLVEDYLGQPLRPFRLDITGKMERDGLKLGIGSSGAVVLLTLRAIAELYELDWSADQLFRLAACVLLKRGDNGSMGDLACIAYENLIYYQSFDRAKVSRWLAEMDLQTVLTMDWGYVIESVKPVLDHDFLVGWTRQPAISSDLVTQVQSAITPDFLDRSKQAVTACRQALETGNRDQLMQSLAQSGQLLADLHPAILTNRLAQLISASQGLTAVAKSSGAGGGDCGIALSFDHHHTQVLMDRWQAADLTLLYKEDYRVKP